MKRKFSTTVLLIACFCIFSFNKVCRANDDGGFDKMIQKKVAPATTIKEWELSPFYNFLEI